MEEGVSLMEKAQKVLDALNAYKNKMIDASQLRRAINQRFSSELRALRAEKDRVDSFESEELPRSMNNMFYYSLRTGNATAYGAKHLFLSDQISAAHLHRNRHYQWVLAEAYEGFEDFWSLSMLPSDLLILTSGCPQSSSLLGMSILILKIMNGMLSKLNIRKISRVVYWSALGARSRSFEI